MQPTTHIDTRMNQRGIRKELVNLALSLGEIEGDRYKLTTQMIDSELDEINRKRKALLDARKKGGVVVVANDGALITAYRANSFDAKRARANKL